MTTNLFGHEREGGRGRGQEEGKHREKGGGLSRERKGLLLPFAPTNRSRTLFEKISFHPLFSLPPPTRFPANCLLTTLPSLCRFPPSLFFSGLRYSVRFKWRIIGGFLAPRLSLRLRPKRPNCNIVSTVWLLHITILDHGVSILFQRENTRVVGEF